MDNVVILTHGFTGSSILSGLMARAGYWCGGSTVQKTDYDTYENQKLVALNDMMMRELEYVHESDAVPWNDQKLVDLEKKGEGIDLAPYREFVSYCDENGPWVWKDPRLMWTIRIWSNLLDLPRTRFILLTREFDQFWISANLRRHIHSRAFARQMLDGMNGSMLDFVESRNCRYLRVVLEELLVDPSATLVRLNDFLGTSLSAEDLNGVYNGPLKKRTKGLGDRIKATAIYLKNYGVRDGRGRKSRDQW